MTPTSQALARWLSHVSGETKLPQVLTPLREAIELNRERQQIISTFGRKRFEALVGFVDMRGFSDAARGLSPEEVRDVAAPFLSAVVEAATRNHCFIDKTSGDEVMLFMPSIGEDVALANIGLSVRDPWPIAVSCLVADMLRLISASAPGRAFAAGSGFGQVVLGSVGGDSYRESTVYGNAVNAAKRIQGLAARLSQDKGRSTIAVGVVVSELGDWFKSEFDFEIWQHVGPVVFPARESRTAQCKGVGDVCYVAAEVELRCP